MFSDNKNIKGNIFNDTEEIIREYDECPFEFAMIKWMGSNNTVYSRPVRISIMSDGTKTFRPEIVKIIKEEHIKKLLPINFR